MTNSALKNSLSGSNLLLHRELLNMNSLATAWQLLSYFLTNMTCKLRFVNTGIVFKILKAETGGIVLN